MFYYPNFRHVTENIFYWGKGNVFLKFDQDF
jgi:hypothetical protein